VSKNRKPSHRGLATGGCGKNPKPSCRGSVTGALSKITAGGNGGGWSAVENMVVVVVGRCVSKRDVRKGA
jgi:hypothetical protein